MIRSLSMRSMLLAGFVTASCFFLGLYRFVWRAEGVNVTVAASRPHPLAFHNLASWQYGPSLRVSSYYKDPLSNHHPIFLVDGHVAPSLQEKWASDEHDLAPWVEIIWHEPRSLERVAIRHAGDIESKQLSLRSYQLECLTRNSHAARLSVSEASPAVAIHDFKCSDATGVRLTAISAKGAIVRLYELEAWGR